MEETKQKRKMILDVDEKPNIWQWIILAFQHVFAMFGATILVPILVNQAAGGDVLSIPVALVTAGIGTLIYILCTRAKSPVFLGSSFAFIAPIALGYIKGGIGGAMTGVMIVGVIYIVVSFIVRLIGKNWLDKVLPKVVIGPMIMIIGLGLASSAVGQIGIVNTDPATPTVSQVEAVETEEAVTEEVAAEESVESNPDLYTGTVTNDKGETIDVNVDYTSVTEEANADTSIKWKGLIVALITFLVTAIVMVRGKGFIKIIPFLIGIVAGYIAAVCFGLVDFTSVQEAAWFSLPNFKLPFKDYSPDLLVALTIAPVALVTMAEHIGDHTALSAIIGKDLLKKPGLENTLLGDGLATLVAGALGGPANTTYGENTSVVGMTKVASVWVIGLAAIFAIILGFLGKFTALVGTIPQPVLGGVSLLLYGFIAVNGLKVLIENQIDFGKNKNIIIASSMLVLGLGGAALTLGTQDVSLTFSGMSLAAIVGILLNLLLPADKEEPTDDEPDEKENKTASESKKTNKKEGSLSNVIELDHPLIEHKLGILRCKKTGTKEFREIAGEIGTFLCYKAMEDAVLDDVEIETPICKMKTKKLDEDKYAFVPILRAGMGLLDGVLNVIPNAKIGHIGMYRDEKNNHKPVNYFFKVPNNIEEKEVILLDPMLATGGSAVDAVELLKGKGVKKIKFICIIAAPEGLEFLHKKHPDVKVYCGKIDDHLNEDAYIVPGLGDAGDRIYGTK